MRTLLRVISRDARTQNKTDISVINDTFFRFEFFATREKKKMKKKFAPSDV